MKVLIAGGAGFIGSTVVSACLDDGIVPVILDNLNTGRREFTRDRIFYQGDIADGPLIDQIFAEHPDIAAVVHAAALIVVPESVAQPLRYYRENVAKSVDFLDHVLRNGCERYLFSSSAAIYRPGDDFSVDETSPLDPISPYARTKVVMEMMLADTASATALRALSLRYFNPIGADPTHAHRAAGAHAQPRARQDDQRGGERRGVPAHRRRLADPRRLRHPRLHPRLGPRAGARRRRCAGSTTSCRSAPTGRTR